MITDLYSIILAFLLHFTGTLLLARLFLWATAWVSLNDDSWLSTSLIGTSIVLLQRFLAWPSALTFQVWKVGILGIGELRLSSGTFLDFFLFHDRRRISNGSKISYLPQIAAGLETLCPAGDLFLIHPYFSQLLNRNEVVSRYYFIEKVNGMALILSLDSVGIFLLLLT